MIWKKTEKKERKREKDIEKKRERVTCLLTRFTVCAFDDEKKSSPKISYPTTFSTRFQTVSRNIRRDESLWLARASSEEGKRKGE